MKKMLNKLKNLVGLDHYAAALMVCLKAGKSAILIGETGTGKTTLAREVAAELGRPFVRVNLDGGSSPDELIGRFQLRGTETFFQEGVIPLAMKQGAVLCLDELNAALPDTLFAIHPLLESEPRLFIPETQEEIIPAPGFCVVATMNPSHDYAGTKALNAALYSRFGIALKFETLGGKRLIEALAVHEPKANTASVEVVARAFEVLTTLRKQDMINTRVTLRECLAALALEREGLTIEEAVNFAIGSKLEDHEKKQAEANGLKFEKRTHKTPSTIDEIFTKLDNVETLERDNKRLTKKVEALSSLEALVKAFKEAAPAVAEACEAAVVAA